MPQHHLTEWEIEQEKIISRFITTPPDAMYDIGVGPKAEWFTLKELYPNMKLFGCEPNHRTVEALLKVGFPGQLYPYAIGNYLGRTTLYITEESKCCSLLPVDKLYPVVGTLDVAVITLDIFDAIVKNQDNILLWMDIEGCEESALRSGHNLLQSGRVKWINLEEIHAPMDEKWPAQWSRRENVDKLLASYGYKRVLEYNKHETNQDVIYVL